ncbi:hypothetical protein XENOCAPTIV_027684 [Xenoophorus captivus]|uniref:Uncharacterized protein n=1 Tax=Xenoophorus captivus TaxID=1517983 RepID=A0ABV0QTR0_9TELE
MIRLILRRSQTKLSAMFHAADCLFPVLNKVFHQIISALFFYPSVPVLRSEALCIHGYLSSFFPSHNCSSCSSSFLISLSACLFPPVSFSPPHLLLCLLVSVLPGDPESILLM